MVAEGEPGDSEEEGERSEGEEGRSAVGIRAPLAVSREERLAHELTHTPYRSWCKYCVKGRGRNMHHRTREEERRNRMIPRVSMDYFFMASADQQASDNPILVMVDGML